MMLPEQERTQAGGQTDTADTQGRRKAVTAPDVSGAIVVSIDAMGGDRGPSAVVEGMSIALKANPALRFIVNGRESEVAPLIAQAGIGAACTLVHAEAVVTMNDKPAQVMRRGSDTSMWATVEAVRDHRAHVAVSCGNTGALMAVSMLRLRKLPGVDRPAIASFWPSFNPSGWNVMLDMGADVRADAPDLLTYALMGASYARHALGLERPRVGLMNVGTEEHKGNAELRAAHELIAAAQDRGAYDFIGFVEGNDLPSDRVDVIVTDGFTGNVALKTGEGTAKMASRLLREAFTSSWMAKLGALLAMRALKRLSARMDPRRANGGVFLGLNGTVIKSHGGADATGVAAAIELAARLAGSGFADRLAARVASAIAAGQDAPSQMASNESAK
ncbi:phosphate acyltransferase PlsX [Paenirhodobacter populi]|nr:phosphate acyltransferase PlsX [Sinirhodobacter populi]